MSLREDGRLLAAPLNLHLPLFIVAGLAVLVNAVNVFLVLFEFVGSFHVCRRIALQILYEDVVGHLLSLHLALCSIIACPGNHLPLMNHYNVIVILSARFKFSSFLVQFWEAEGGLHRRRVLQPAIVPGVFRASDDSTRAVGDLIDRSSLVGVRA